MNNFDDFLGNVDIDVNHFSELYPNLPSISDDQLYSSQRFNAKILLMLSKT